MKHYPVMLREAIRELKIKSDGVYVDATVGYAGHSKEILKTLKRGQLFAFDQDGEALESARKTLSLVGNRFTLIHSNFVHLKSELEKRGVTHVDGILFDLGFSSPQIDNASRGFSFMQDGDLDMRMNQEDEITASLVVNTYSEEELTKLFFTYGEEKRSKAIAKCIIAHRPIYKTLELVDVIEKSVGANYFYKQHPERKIFQALRIEVNQELKVLESVLPDAISMLHPGGRIVVITFHSLEDRMVKQIFRKYSEVDALVRGLPVIPEEYKPVLKLVNRKAISPSEEEILENSRSKSALLRVGEKL